MAVYTTIDNPGLFFNTKLYTGNGTAIGSGGNAVTGVGFQPDWVWIKNRTDSANHNLYDAVRGVSAGKLKSNTNVAEAFNAQDLSVFGTDGFTVGENNEVNGSSDNMIAWNWLGANGTSSNSDGSITSTVSANTTAGFSIVSYTGTGANATIGHGLGAVPKWIITKDRNNSNSWYVYHVSIGNTHGLRLNTTDAKEDDATLWNDTTPTSSVFSVGSNTGTNRSANAIIAYCFAEKQGYSKFGSYTGNGNNDGAFVFTGFKPAWVVVKRTDDVHNWWIWDNKLNPSNLVNQFIYANSSAAEQTDTWGDFLSNGFKLRMNYSGGNGSGGTYAYMAFAENPFVTAGTKAAGTAR